MFFLRMEAIMEPFGNDSIQLELKYCERRARALRIRYSRWTGPGILTRSKSHFGVKEVTRES